MRARKLIFFCVLIIFMTCQKNVDIELTSYLDEWLGVYEGTSHHWYSFYNGFEAEITHTYRNVSVEVQLGSLDSTMNESRLDFKFFDDMHTTWAE